MTSDAMVMQLVECFVSPPDAVITKLKRIAETIPEDARQDVIDKILETETSSVKISVKHIVEACRALGVSYRETRYLPAEDWICDCCGHEFKYHQSPSDDERIDKEIYDFCPMCGFQPGWSILAQAYKDRGQKVEWYDRLLEQYHEAYGPTVKSHQVRIGSPSMGMSLNRGGIFWSRHKAEEERAKDRHEAINQRMAEIDKAKRWDIADGRE